MEEILAKIIEEKADEKDRADFRAFRDITASWATRVNDHNKRIEEILNKT